MAAGDADRIFLRLGPRGALGSDGEQWIVYRPRHRVAPLSTGLRYWNPVAFVRSTRSILDRCILEAGIELSADGAAALAQLPSTFAEWKASDARRHSMAS